MKTMKYTFPLFGIILFVVSIALQGCGSEEQQGLDCPSGSAVAMNGDAITGPVDATFTISSSVGSVFGGGLFLYPPITFTITDPFNEAKNGICAVVYTGDTGNSLGGPFWYTDSTYAAIITGVGPLNRRVVKSDSSGNVVLYWSTAILPPANPRVVTGGTATAPTYAAGGDQKGTSFISIYSGPLSKTWNVEWTVGGEPAN